MTRPAASVLSALGLLLATAASAQERLPEITPPVAELGFEIGADYRLADYTQLVAYWQKLARESDRMVLDTIGLSEDGRPQLMAILTSPANHGNLARYEEISRRMAKAEGIGEDEAERLAAEGKAVVWIDGGLHADEVLGAQQLMALVYDMTSLTDAETLRFLDDVILLAVLANPDGMELVSDWYMRESEPTARSLDNLPELYQRYAGHDNNRDFFMANLAETRNMNRVLYTEWLPQIVYNHHQTGPAGAVMFSPPFRDPPNYNIHPLVLTNLEQVGGHMHARFAREGKTGVTTRSGSNYSTWWNGGLRTTPYFHNMIGLLTETIGSPTPQIVPFLPSMQLERNDLPLPVEPGPWRFARSIDYSLTANRAVLDFASRNRELLLLNIWSMGRDAIARGRRDSWENTPAEIYAAEEELGPIGSLQDFARILRRPEDREPRAYVIRSDQVDFNTAIKFVNTLLMNGIDVERATAPFTVDGSRYPAGSLVVRTAQAFAPHVLDMFEPQVHPNDFAFPGGPPIPPYDLTGWTLALQMGVEFDRILDAFEGPFERVQAWNLELPTGRVLAGETGGFLLDHRVNDAFKVVNGLLAEGGEVWWMRQPVTAQGQIYPAGAFYVNTDPARMERLARAAGVSARAVNGRPSGEAMRLRPGRVGLVDEYGGSTQAGWTRMVLEDFGFDFSVVYPAELDAGNLAARYDVLIFPDGAIPAAGQPRAPFDVEALRAKVPAEYRDRVGAITAETTVPAILDFVRRGGTAITVGSSTRLAAYAGLPVSSHLVDPEGVPWPREAYFIPGSLLRMDLDHATPLTDGLGSSAVVMFDRSPVLDVAPDAPGIRVLGRYGSRPLLSGWAWGQEKLDGGVALAEADVGRGKLFLLTPAVTFRGQPHGTFPLLFNAILYGPVRKPLS